VPGLRTNCNVEIQKSRTFVQSTQNIRGGAPISESARFSFVRRIAGSETGAPRQFAGRAQLYTLLISLKMLQSGVIGTILNVAAILAGGLAGLFIRKQPSAATQSFFKVVLGALTVFFGLRLTVLSLSGTFGHILKQIGIMLLSLMLGNLLGKLLRLQKASNRVGTLTRDRMTRATPGNPERFMDGFIVCSLLFCAAPLGILGAIHNGLDRDYFFPLAIKGVMDGLATMSFAAMFGWGVLLSAVPVLIFEGTITLLCAHSLAPFLEARQLTDSVNATGGMLIFCVALLIFEVRRVPVTDYLPSLIFAPLLTWLLR